MNAGFLGVGLARNLLLENSRVNAFIVHDVSVTNVSAAMNSATSGFDFTGKMAAQTFVAETLIRRTINAFTGLASGEHFL